MARRKTGAGQVCVRMSAARLRALDAWIARQPKPMPTRPEAIRQMLDVTLAIPAHLEMPHAALISAIVAALGS